MTHWPFSFLRKGQYRVIYADPPWPYETFNSEKRVPQRGTADASLDHYQVMSMKELAALPVADLAAPDCALLMWSTSAHTPQALWLAEQWGFKFSSKAFTWAKLNKIWGKSDDQLTSRDWDFFDTLPHSPEAKEHWFMGMGHSTRRNTEDCWLFTRGKPKRLSKGVRELVVSPLREHSRKPDEMYDRIEALFGGPYCELFARTKRAGWSSWGNETEKF